jgi:hypothetical protein
VSSDNWGTCQPDVVGIGNVDQFSRFSRSERSKLLLL